MIETKNINNYKKYKVDKIKGLNDNKKIYHGELFNEKSIRMLLVAPTTGGKTTVIFHLIKHLLTTQSSLIYISNTVNRDDIVKKIIKNFEKHIDIKKFDKLNLNIINELREILNEDESDDSHDDEIKEENVENKYDFLLKKLTKTNDKKEKKKKGKLDNMIYTKNLVIIDDVSKQKLRGSYIYDLIKEIRHYGSIIISCQDYNSVNIDARQQLNYICIFRGLTETKLKQIYDDIISDISFDDFKRLYYYCIRKVKKKGFLLYDISNNQFRYKLHKLLSLKKSN